MYMHIIFVIFVSDDIFLFLNKLIAKFFFLIYSGQIVCLIACCLLNVDDEGDDNNDDDDEDNDEDVYDYHWGYLIIFLYFDKCREHNTLVTADLNSRYVYCKTSLIVKIVGCIFLMNSY